MAFDFGEQKTSDPMADFLARERESAGVLSGDAELFGSSGGAAGGAPNVDDFEKSASAFPALDDDDSLVPGATSNTNTNNNQHSSSAAVGFGFDDHEDDHFTTGAGAPTSNKAGTDDEVNKFQQNFPELDDAQPAGTAANGNSFNDDMDHNDANGFMSGGGGGAGSRSGGGIPTSTVQQVPSYAYTSESTEDPEPVLRWRESQKDAIAKRDAEAERKKAESISKAEQEIDSFYAEYNAKKEKSIAHNKEMEAKFNEKRQQQLAEGTTWSRINKLLDLENSQSKTIAKVKPGNSDLARMKQLYLSLRREGETAPGAAGY